MRTLIVSQHYAPEVTAARFRLEAFAGELVGRGHEVEVVSAVPNHPRGVVEPGYRWRAVVRRSVGGARVTYVWVVTSPAKTLLRRLGNYGSFAAMASIVGALRPRPDVILATSPPLPAGAAAAAVARRHRAPWVLDVRDLWPDAAVSLGELTNRRAIAAAERLERSLYRRASAIVTVNGAFGEEIAARSPDAAVVEVIPNGTTREWLAAGEAAPRRAQLGLPDERFVWAYAGNLGLAHGLDTAIEAAARLGDGFRLLIIGDGPRRAELERLAAAIRPGMVELRPLMTPADASAHLRAADALLVSERQERTVASKLYDYAAVGRPVVAASRGELRRLVEAEGVGIGVPHGDAAALAGAVRALRDDAHRRETLARRGREFARRHLREEQAARLADLLERVAATHKPS